MQQYVVENDGYTVDIEPAIQLFIEHAGWSYNPATETPEQGKRRNAERLAKAKLHASIHGWYFEWSDDWSVGNHRDFYGEAYDDGEPETCEQCDLYDADGNLLQSIGCVDGASREYRLVVEAELADEALSNE